MKSQRFCMRTKFAKSGVIKKKPDELSQNVKWFLVLNILRMLNQSNVT